MLSNFQWYRRLRGGEWHRICLKYVPGMPEFWVQGDPGKSEAQFIVSSEFFFETKGGIGKVSDGYHTFDELYEHRHLLFILLVSTNQWYLKPWKSKLHDDGPMYPGWFIAGTTLPSGPISYHLPLEYWDLLNIQELPQAPKWDGHTSKDVVERLKQAIATITG